MVGTVLDVVNARSFWLLIIGTDGRIVEQPVEPRYMFDVVAGLGLSAPADLVGREIVVSEEGLAVGFPD